MGNQRKFSARLSVRVVRLAYAMVDAVAVCALGTLASNTGDMNYDSGFVDKNSELTGFRAPFLLLHLGGPDTITACSIEDNELWLRHDLGLVIQTGLTLYVFLMSWTGSLLSFLTFPIILVGFCKYGERVWILQFASMEELPKSCYMTPLQKHSEATDFQWKLDSRFYMRAIEKAYFSIQRVKRLFVDLVFSMDDRNVSYSTFEHLEWEQAYKVIEIELGFMYEFFYTKALVVHTSSV